MTKKPRNKPLRFLVTSALLIGPAVQGCDLIEMAPIVEAPEPGVEPPEPEDEALRPGVAPPETVNVAPEPVVEAPDPGVTAPDPSEERDPGLEGIDIPMGTNVVAPDGRRQHRPGDPN